jgi:hypothetical protein
MEEAKPEDIEQSLAFALIFNGKKRTHEADQLMAHIVAKHLVEHLRRSNFVIMRRLPQPGHSTSMQKPSWTKFGTNGHAAVLPMPSPCD